MKRRKIVIAIDFDGTIVKNKWPGVGKYRFGAITILRWLKKRGHTLILYTCREHNGNEWENHKSCPLCQAIFPLRYDKGILFDYVNQNCAELIAKYSDTRKIGAHLYIDDLGAGIWIWPLIPIIVWFKERRWKDDHPKRNNQKM